MKNINYYFYAISITLVIVFTVTGCKIKDITTSDISADNVSIYYGTSSYAMFEVSEAVISELQDAYNNLTFQSTNAKIDMSTMYNIVFYKNGQQIASLSVDQNGVFMLNGDTARYKKKSGNLNYSRITEIYNNAKSN